MEIIQRKIKQKRGERTIIYPFTTYSIIFQSALITDPIQRAVCYFLNEMFTHDLPDKRSSVSQQKELITQTSQSNKHEIIEMCRLAEYQGAGRKQHDVVQQYFLENDPCTIAIECPIFDNELLGHMDILRVLSDRVQILDFKPNAHKETKAASQILRYRRLLRQKLPGVKIEAAYFDENNIYFLI